VAAATVKHEEIIVFSANAFLPNLEWLRGFWSNDICPYAWHISGTWS